MTFESILKAGTSLSIGTYLLCLGVALGCGVIVSIANYFLGTRSKNMFVSISIIPMVVTLVVMLMNDILTGGIGTGIAIAGAFALVRFRSVPGTAKEIAVVFLVMGLGIACGLGYLGLAAISCVVITLCFLLLSLTPFGREDGEANDLRITIPENLDYTTIFDEVFAKYTKKIRLEKIKTVNLGTMIELKYRICLKDKTKEKEFLDEIRIRNGNLTVILSRASLRDELSL